MAKESKVAPAATFSFPLVLAAGEIDVEASLEACRTALGAKIEADKTIFVDVAMALDDIFDAELGKSVPQPYLQGKVAMTYITSPSDKRYQAYVAATLEYLHRNNQDAMGTASKYLVVKGPGQGVYRRCDFVPAAK